MSLLILLAVLAMLAVCAWLVQKYVIVQPYRTLMLVVIIVTAVYVVLNATGLLAAIRGVMVPHV